MWGRVPRASFGLSRIASDSLLHISILRDIATSPPTRNTNNAPAVEMSHSILDISYDKQSGSIAEFMMHHDNRGERLYLKVNATTSTIRLYTALLRNHKSDDLRIPDQVPFQF
jgi:hypothetical protein